MFCECFTETNTESIITEEVKTVKTDGHTADVKTMETANKTSLAKSP